MIENKLSSMLLSDLVIIRDHSNCSKLCYLEIYVEMFIGREPQFLGN